MLLNIITITKDDIFGLNRTLNSSSDFLLNCDSRVNQIIIDGSEPKTKIEINPKTKEKVHYFQTPANGISNAFNQGIKASNGKWLWFLNGGDQIYSLKNTQLMLNIIEKSSADIIVFKIAYGEGLIEREFPPMWLQWPPISAWLPHPGMIIRRKVFDKLGLFDETYKGVMDYDMWIKVTSSTFKIDLISIPLVTFDLGGLSSNQSRLIAKECLRSIQRNSFLIIKTIFKRKKLLIQDFILILKKAYLLV